MTFSAMIRSKKNVRANYAGFYAIFLLIAFPYSIASAQAPGGSLATSYASNSDKPIDIVADVLEVDDQKKIAVFKGNVSATQGDFNLRAKELQVTYQQKENGQADRTQPAAEPVVPGGGADITQIDAKGKVLVKSGDDQTATSDWAIFDVKKQLVTIGGDVVLSQGPNTIKGNRLVIDLNTGLSRFETGGELGGDKTKQRLRAIFTPKSRPETKKPETKN
jgi:lipopolysaccharide export system protein LptA